jgi:hypothetical protein
MIYKEYTTEDRYYIVESEEDITWDGLGYPSYGSKVWCCLTENTEELQAYKALFVQITEDAKAKEEVQKDGEKDDTKDLE